ncbi:MAG: Aspartate 1-decarboxylase [Verrucomicrobiae bacterium]|nr:Aspartate 1-decarboxylase [Verrucomicrobiae bacterium]
MKLRHVLEAKLHGGTITECDLHYEGSCGLGIDLLKASGIVPFEKVAVLNVATGARLETYAILSKKKGAISLNGAAARGAAVGDKVIILTYATIAEKDLTKHKAQIVILDERNRIKSSHTGSPTL